MLTSDLTLSPAPTPAPALTLVTGPARSGKSEWAESLAHQAAQGGASVTYIATGQWDPQDQDWCDRLERHRQRRPPTWQTLECPLDLVPVLQASTAHECLLIDSLGTWVANYIEKDGESWRSIEAAVLQQLPCTAASIIAVAEETGWGVIPATAVGRVFRDRLGSCIRQVGQLAQRVYLVTGGYAVDLTQVGTPLPPLDLGSSPVSARPSE